MTILFALSGIVLGLIIGYLIAHAQNTSLRAKLEMTTTDNIRLAGEKETMKKECARQLSEAQDISIRQLDKIREEAARQQEMIRTDYAKQIADLREQQREQLDQQLRLLREQMTTASEKILKDRSAELSQTNQQQLAAILNPLRTEITQMKETVDKSGREHATSMERLDASIKANMEKANLLSERADRLANALTGEDHKSQGNFGELRLKQLLEDMGLEEGVQFEEQTSMKDEFGRTIYEEEDGRRLIPDVILHFPDNRDVIIDSKMSFTAFVDYQNAKTDEERNNALQRHITSVRSHVSELAKKNYSKYIKADHSRLDFVLMYVFQESALQLALANAPTLWKEAYDQGVIISGSQNLYMMLRVLELTWRQVRQVENQQKIMEAANAVIDRVQIFYDRFLKVEEQFDKTRKAFDDMKNITAPTGQSIATAANKLLKFGAKENPKRKQRVPKESDATASLASTPPQIGQSAASPSEC